MVVVDDFIPVDKSTLQSPFSKTTNGSFWISILEKAWAKIHGSYEATFGGNIGDAYLILTGAPTHVINIEREQMNNNLM